MTTKSKLVNLSMTVLLSFPAWSAQTLKPVSWSRIAGAIEGTICVKEHTVGNTMYRAVSVGWRKNCGLHDPKSPLELAVQDAFLSSGSLITYLRIDDRVRERTVHDGLRHANKEAKALYLSDPQFLRVLVPRVQTALLE